MKIKIIFLSLIGSLLMSTVQLNASNKELFEETETQINNMTPGDTKLLVRSVFNDLKSQENLDSKAFIETMSQFGVTLNKFLPQENNPTNNNAPRIHIIENNNIQPKVKNPSLNDLPVEEKFKLLSFMKVEPLEDGSIYGADPKTEEGIKNILSMQMYCDSMLTERVFQQAKEANLGVWNWNLKQNNEKSVEKILNLEVNNNQINNNAPTIHIIENNNIQPKVKNPSLNDLPVEEKFKLLSFMKVEPLEDGSIYGADPKTEEGIKNILSMQMYCDSMLTEKTFQLAKEANLELWNWNLKQNNEQLVQNNQFIEKELEEKRAQEKKRIEEEEQKRKEIERKRIEEEKKRYQEKVEKFVSGCEELLKDAQTKILNQIKADYYKKHKNNPNFEKVSRAMGEYEESSMSVTAAFKQTDFFLKIKNFLSQTSLKIIDNNTDEILMSILKTQQENKGLFSTYNHVNGWLNSYETQDNFSHLMESIRLIHASGNLSLLVLEQGAACANGLNGRALYFLMNILEERLEGVKKGNIQLLG